MLPGMKILKYIHGLLYLSLSVFFLSLIFAFRGYASIAIGVVVVLGFIRMRLSTGKFLNPRLNNIFFVCCSLFFLVQLAFLFFVPGNSVKSPELLLRSSIIFVPLALCSSDFVNPQNFRRLLNLFMGLVLLATLYCLLIATWNNLFHQQDANIFVYHRFASPIGQHAVQFSLFIFVVLACLLEQVVTSSTAAARWIIFAMIVYLSCILLLLSSKLVISALMLVFIYYAIRFKIPWLRLGVIVITAIIAIALFTRNAISQRFREVLASDLHLVERERFDPNTYFNGIQFRLLQARFVKEILSENQAWIFGVGPRSQDFLNDKYKSANMYLGDGKDDPGYQRYDTHNQFLESLLQFGLPGLLTFSALCFSMLVLAMRRRSRTLIIVTLVWLAYSLNESVLQRQFGIMIFLFFPLYIYYGTANKASDRKLPAHTTFFR